MRSEIKYIVRFDIPLTVTNIKYCADGIIDLRYKKLTEAYKNYKALANTSSLVDLIEIKNGVEYCLL